MPLKPATSVTMGSPPLFLPPVLREPEKAKAREFAWYLLLGDQLGGPIQVTDLKPFLSSHLCPQGCEHSTNG